MNKKILYLIIGLVIVIIIIVLAIVLNRQSANKAGLPNIPFYSPAPSSSSSASSGNKNSGSQGVDPNDVLKADQDLRQSSPDTYLSNKVPYISDQFSINLGMSKTQPVGHLSFVVSLKISNQDQAKNSFISWLKSLQLTDNQINSLDIAYLDPQAQLAVLNFKNSLPYYGTHMGILYNIRPSQNLDSTRISIDKAFQSQGEQEFKDYLQKFGVGDQSWISNLTIEYN